MADRDDLTEDVEDIVEPAQEVAESAITSPEPIVQEAGAELERLVREVQEELHTHNEHFNVMVGHLAATTEALSRAVQAVAEGATEAAADAASTVLDVPAATTEAIEDVAHETEPGRARRRHGVGKRR